MTDCDQRQSDIRPELLTHGLTAKPTHGKLMRLVTLVSNMKKSPWLLSRCKESPSHIQALIDLLRPEDKITVAVKLESGGMPPGDVSRYLVVASTGENRVQQQESAIIGVDVVKDVVSIGLVLPICEDMDIQMDGDGGFNVSTSRGIFSFRPVSVQAMWSALQSLVKAVYYARYHRQSMERSSHSWVSYYINQINSSQECIYEWNRINDGGSVSPTIESTEDIKLKLGIKRKLRDIMTNEKDVDLENVTSKYLREKLEVALNVDLNPYKRFVDEEMVVVMRQMDSPSLILDYLYLGSEWNASNVEELKHNRIGYILNVTREIDNFFPGMFKYCNVRVDDTEETQLLRHWNNTYKFIEEAKKSGSRILVHCKMGVSRSASTVIAYVMKECGMPFLEAYQHVKHRRNCVKPNPGFMQQLDTYEGILGASKQRHNRLFRSRSAETLDEDQGAISEEKQKSAKRIKSDQDAETDKPQGDEDSKLADASIATNETSPDTRDSQFSIDSVDGSLTSEVLPVVTEYAEENPAVVEHSIFELVCPPSVSAASPSANCNSKEILPMSVLDDPALPVSSMLRKLSFQVESIQLDAVTTHGRLPPQLHRREESVFVEVSPLKRSSSWPRRQKDDHRSAPSKQTIKILRPNANPHKKLRMRRSKTIAVDD